MRNGETDCIARRMCAATKLLLPVKWGLETPHDEEGGLTCDGRDVCFVCSAMFASLLIETPGRNCAQLPLGPC